jgi:hypothetical protein
MAKLLFAAASAALLFNTASFAAESRLCSRSNRSRRSPVLSADVKHPKRCPRTPANISTNVPDAKPC